MKESMRDKNGSKESTRDRNDSKESMRKTILAACEKMAASG